MFRAQAFDIALGDLFFHIAADTLYHALIMGFHQRDGGAFFTGAGSTADTVQVHIGRAWHVKVDDMADIRQVNPPRRDIGGDQDIGFTFTETTNGIVAGGLCHFTWIHTQAIFSDAS